VVAYILRPQYSNTPCGALRRIRDCGWRSLLRNPAAFHRLPLHDYTHPAGGGRYARGVFRVVRTLTEEERTRITARCEELLDDHHKFPYDLFKINCESAAFHVSHDAHLATHKLSAQVRLRHNTVFVFFPRVCVRRAEAPDTESGADRLGLASVHTAVRPWFRLRQSELREQPRVSVREVPGEQRA